MWAWTFKPELYNEKVGWAEVFQALRKLNDNIPIIYLNQFYWVPRNPKYVMKKTGAHKYPYKKNGRQCENFIQITKGELAKAGYGNLLMIYASVNMPNRKSPHALFAFYNPIFMQVNLFGDPQTGEYITKKEHQDKLTFNHFIY